MGKHRIRHTVRQARAREAIPIQIPLPLLDAYLDARQSFAELCVHTGRQVLGARRDPAGHSFERVGIERVPLVLVPGRLIRRAGPGLT